MYSEVMVRVLSFIGGGENIRVCMRNPVVTRVGTTKENKEA